MEIRVTFPGGQKVAAQIGSHTILTDQPVDHGGDNSAASPWELFLASLATCAGYFAMAWCEARSIPLDGLQLTQEVRFDEQKKRLEGVTIRVRPPEGLTAAQIESLCRSIEQCKVKKAIAAQPLFEVRAV